MANANNILDHKITNSISMQNNGLLVGRKEFFCVLQDIPQIWKNYLIISKKPSTINIMMLLLKKYGNIPKFYNLINSTSDKSDYCFAQESLSIGNYSEFAKKHKINFFMHYTTDVESLMYTTAIMSPSKLKYMNVEKLLGSEKFISYLQAVKTDISILDVVNIDLDDKQQKNITNLSDYFIFSTDILDIYPDWYSNYGWIYGAENSNLSTPQKDFDKWLTKYGTIDHSIKDIAVSDRIDKTWPVVNEFIFKNPISLQYCLKIIISKDKIANSKLLQVFQKLCPNTFLDATTFETNRSKYHFTGKNHELINLNYDLVYSFIEEYPNIDIFNIDDDTLNKFRVDNGIEKIYYFPLPDNFIIIGLLEAEHKTRQVPIADSADNILINKLVHNIRTKTDVPIYKYYVENRFAPFINIIKNYDYPSKIEFPFIGVVKNGRLYNINILLYQNLVKKLDDQLLDPLIGRDDRINIENIAENYANEIIKIIDDQSAGTVDYYDKYIKYKLKYLRLKERLLL